MTHVIGCCMCCQCSSMAEHNQSANSKAAAAVQAVTYGLQNLSV